MRHYGNRAVALVSLLGALASVVSRPAPAQQYIITNLGTLGNYPASLAFHINSSGQIIGIAGAPDNSGGYTGHAFLWQNGTMTDLTPSSSAISLAYGINDSGQVVGGGVRANSSESIHAYLWQNSMATDLNPTGSSGSVAYAINNAGQILEQASTTDESGNSVTHAFLWQNEIAKDLTPSGFSISTAYAINENGQVVGIAGNTGSSIVQAFLWQNGTATMINPPSGFVYAALPGPFIGFGGSNNVIITTVSGAINSAGQVVGAIGGVDNFGKAMQHAFLWQNGTTLDLGTLPGFSISSASAINDAGQIIGQADNGPFTAAHAFFWQNGTMTDLNPSGFTSSAAAKINRSGQIVGEADNGSVSSVHAFLWQNGTATDLNALLPANSGWVLNAAADINNNGQIVGIGLYQGQVRAFLLNSWHLSAASPGLVSSLPTPMPHGHGLPR